MNITKDIYDSVIENKCGWRKLQSLYNLGKQEAMEIIAVCRWANDNGKNLFDDPQIIKNVIVADTHAPFENKRAIDAVCEYILEYKPNRIIHLGDVGDYQSVSYWLKNKRLSLEGLNIQDDIDSATDVLKKIGSCASNAEKIVLFGNHENWVYQYIDEHPELRKTINIPLSYKSVGWITKPFNDLYKIWKLYLTHGLFVGLYHAARTVQALSASCMYGHTHDDQKHTVSFLDGEKSGMSIGCLCNMNPEYLKNRPKRWVNGFATVDVLQSGDFFPDFIKIIRNKFSRMGKIYGK